MLNGVLSLILDTLASFLTMLLLTRALMRWLRISFINPLGQFILATTDWLVRPAQKLLPGGGPGFDLSCWIPAWLVQVLLAFIGLALMGVAGNVPGSLLAAFTVGALETLRALLQLVMVVVLMAAVLSWVNPRAPIAPMVNALARPFVLPIARRLPLLGGVDLSPLVVMLIVQVLLFVLAGLRSQLIGFAFS